MSTLSPDQMASLEAEMAKTAYDGMTPQQRWDAVHRPQMVPNPVTVAPQVPRPYTLAGVLATLSPASLANVEAIPYLPSVVEDIEINNIPGCQKWAALFAGTAKITPDEATAILAIVSATMADPNWTAEVPGPSVKNTLFPGATWVVHGAGTNPDLSPIDATIDYIPLADVASARSN